MDGPLLAPGVHQTAAANSIVDGINTRAAEGERDSSCWAESHLGETDWIILNNYLSRVIEPIDYGYFSRSETFVHQIASPSHELLRRSFARILIRKLRRLCTENEVRSFARRITDATPPESKTGSKANRDLHQPDIFFSHISSPRYGIAVEIGYSQKLIRLQELAEFYILKSNRKTRLFIAIEYDRNRDCRVTLRTWRRDYTDPTGRGLRCRVQELRGANGALIPGSPLQVCMLDFARQELIPPFLHGRHIELSVAELGAALQEADSLEEIEESDSESSDDADDTEEAAEDEWPFELVPFAQ